MNSCGRRIAKKQRGTIKSTAANLMHLAGHVSADVSPAIQDVINERFRAP